MRVLIDGSMAQAGGGFTYLANVLPNIAVLSPESQFRVLLRNPKLADALPERSNLEVELLEPVAGIRQRLQFSYLEAPRLAKQWKADLYYSAGETVPLRTSCPSIASFQNPNVFSRQPLQWPWKQRVRLSLLRVMAAVSARCAQRVMFVSEDSAQWIGDQLGLPESHRAPIQHGINADHWSEPLDAPLHPNPYILSVSSIYRYKNYVRLIEAYTELAKRRNEIPDLVIIGDDQDPEYAQQMYQARDASGALAEKIHILGEIPYAEIQSYYAGAAAFVFPSYLETFGIPLLEAMASGLPTVAADIPVFREVGGDAVLYADPFDTADLAKAMEHALHTDGVARALARRGRERAREFTWEKTAMELLHLFSSVHSEHTARNWDRPLTRPELAKPAVLGG